MVQLSVFVFLELMTSSQSRRKYSKAITEINNNILLCHCTFQSVLTFFVSQIDNSVIELRTEKCYHVELEKQSLSAGDELILRWILKKPQQADNLTTKTSLSVSSVNGVLIEVGPRYENDRVECWIMFKFFKFQIQLLYSWFVERSQHLPQRLVVIR